MIGCATNGTDWPSRERRPGFGCVGLRGGSLPLYGLVRDAVRRRGNAKSRLLELSPTETGKLKIAIKVGDVTRTLEMTDAPSMRSYYEIRDQVTYGLNGLPTFESVDEIAHGLLDKQYEMLGL